MLNILNIEGRPSDTRVVGEMSGGVDSSVTAALLADAGYDVVGVTLQLYDHGAATHRKGACCAGRDIHDARAVAQRIGIPHYVLDYEDRFKEAVIDRFAQSYVAGETPVPCVECNQSIKFRDLLETARELGAKVLATGHYVASRAAPSATRAISCSRQRARSLICCGFRSVIAPRPRRANWRAATALPSPTSMTARTSASCRPVTTQMSSSGCGPAPPGPAKSSISTAVCSASTTASFISRSASAAVWASPPARRSMSCVSTPHRDASWSVRAKRCAQAAFACATSIGSATAASKTRSRAIPNCS